MEWEQIVPGVIGAFVGVVGWLAVGVYIQRLQFRRESKNAARAVYFELEMNLLAVRTAADYNVFTPLSRGSFDRLLPDLATWLDPVRLKSVVSAYMAHTGYEQVRSGHDLPEAARRQALSGIRQAQAGALELLQRVVFNASERQALKPSDLVETS